MRCLYFKSIYPFVQCIKSLNKIEMKTLKLGVSFILLLHIGFTALAQNNTSKKIEEAKEIVEEAGETVKEVDKLFKSVFGNKKENKQEKEVSKKSQPSNTNTEKTKNTSEEKKVTKNSNQLKAGSIHPDAVELDVDKLYPFYNGAAIVQKGKSTALINAKGEFIVPFNKYDIDVQKSKNGFFMLRGMEPSRGKVGFLNATGKFIDLKEFHGSNYQRYPRSVRKNYLNAYDKLNKISYFIDNKGHMFKIQNSNINEFPSEGMILFSIKMKKGYKNLKDQIVIKPIYDYAEGFRNGAAVVGKKNEFGEIKYGYIDLKGNAITALQFSKKPEPFSDDRAKVYYKEYGKYSFIDKKGQVVYTESSSYGSYGPFIYNYSKTRKRGGSVIMDKEGSTYSGKGFLNLLGINEDMNTPQIEFPNYITYKTTNFNDPNAISFWFDTSLKSIRNNGLLFLNEKKAFYGTFTAFLGTEIYDPVSKLTIATFKNSNNYGDITEGYVNQNGVFMIIKGEASKW